MDEEEVHIAVGKNSRKEKSNILWAAANFPRATIVLVHVHWPSKWMPFMGGKVLYKFADEKEKEMHRGRETKAMVNILSQYKNLCGTRKEDEALTEQGTVESIASEEMESFAEEDADQSDEIQSFRNITEKAEKIMEEIDRLQKKLKELQGEGHNRIVRSISRREMAASLKRKSLSEPRYPELQIPENIGQFSTLQIANATESFHSRNFIGEGGYGPVYKGKLGGTPVAIKLLKPHGRQGFPEYQQEVVLLSKLDHPHIVRLIGVCAESCSLVYELLPNGTLLDRLSKGLLWKDRVRILAEQRSALAYLHSRRPHAIIHADLKLANILLDAVNVSRLGDFGTARAVHVKPLEEETIGRRTNPMGTTGYMDPVFFMTGELTTESDVYAFGVVILQLLTGLLDLNVAEQAREAVKMDAVHSVLDASAGAWPEVQAERLLKLALRCCSLERKRRPAITADAEWRSLDILRAMSTPASKSRKWNSHAS
ncbi:unnamed protein product [Urochloa humidicola]